MTRVDLQRLRRETAEIAAELRTTHVADLAQPMKKTSGKFVQKYAPRDCS